MYDNRDAYSFQFHKVQLKATIISISHKPSAFQFHKVQLKAMIHSLIAILHTNFNSIRYN